MTKQVEECPCFISPGEDIPIMRSEMDSSQMQPPTLGGKRQHGGNSIHNVAIERLISYCTIDF